MCMNIMKPKKTLLYGMTPEYPELALLVLRGIKSGCRRLGIPIA